MIHPTYKKQLLLSHENQSWFAGLSLCNANLGTLMDNRELFLHPKESIYFENLVYPKRQLSYLLGRYSAKQALSAYLKEENLTTICIENGFFQQPIVSHSLHSNLQVSLSHAEEYSLAIAFHEVHTMGVDIELINAEKINTIKTQLTESEKKYASTFLNEMTILTLMWTAKEALSKVLKCGLLIPFELLEIVDISEDQATYFSEFKNFSQYTCLSFQLDNTICSIVYPKKIKIDFDITQLNQFSLDFC